MKLAKYAPMRKSKCRKGEKSIDPRCPLLRRSFAILGCLVVVLLFSAEAIRAEERVDRIEVTGAKRIDDEAILLQVESVPGILNQETVSADIKRIYQTGFFDQVTASLATEEELTILRFRLIEKPVVRKVFLKGNEAVKNSELQDIIQLDARRFLDRTQVEALSEGARLFYQSKGYYDAEVEHTVVPVSENQVDVTFTFKEGERYKIREIRIKGLEQVDEDDLLDEIQTSHYKWWNSWLFGTGRLNQEMLQNDRTIMRQFFINNGYIDAQIQEPTIEKVDNGLVVSFRVDEGEQYTVGRVLAEGSLINESEEETLEGLKVVSGDVFSGEKMRDATFAISEKFTDVGYAYANVVPTTGVDQAARTVDVTFGIDQGPLVTVNRINVRGNDKTYDNVIRRELLVQEQELYSSSRIRRSQTLLERLGYFEEVNITNEQTDIEDTIDLGVTVREGSTGTLSAGAGFSSSDGVLGNARISENNVFGRGVRVVLNVDIGEERNNIVLSYDDPRFNDSYWSVGVSAVSTEREFDDFDRGRTAGSIRTGYPLGQVFGEWAKDVRFGLQYELADNEISNVDADSSDFVKMSEGTATTSALTPSLTRNTINNPLNPRKGSRQVLSTELAGLGGDEEYVLFEARNQWYYPLFQTFLGEFVFSWRTRFGYGETFNSDPLPLFKRYFPGGINSVRGYEARTLGPTDENGNEFGGAKQLVNNFEIIFPLVESAGLRGVVFYDAGEAFDDNVNIDFGDLRLAWGYGIRWTSPLGPIRVEFGFPIDREDDEDSMVTLFSFGAPL